MATQLLGKAAAAVTLATGLLVPGVALGAFAPAYAATGSGSSQDSEDTATGSSQDVTSSTEVGESDSAASTQADAGSGLGGDSGAASDSGTPAPGVQDTARSAVGGKRLAATSTVVATDAPELPDTLDADAFVLADARTGDVLAAHDAHGRFAPGSALTMLTGLALLTKLDATETYTPTKDDVVDEGPQVGLEAGTAYTADDLFYALFLHSANDAASTLVSAAPGGSDVGIAAVQAEAKRLRADDTRVVNAGGVDAARQTTSAYDLALIAREGLKNADFARYVSTKAHTLGSGASELAVVNRNKLLVSYDGMSGVSTATTGSGVGTYVSAATRDGRTLIAVVMTTQDSATAQAADLLDWGFALPAETTAVGRLVAPTAAASTSFLATGSTSAQPESTKDTKKSSGTGFGTEAGLSMLLMLLAGGVIAAGVLRAGRTGGAQGGAAGEGPVMSPPVPAQRSDADPRRAPIRQDGP